MAINSISIAAPGVRQRIVRRRFAVRGIRRYPVFTRLPPGHTHSGSGARGIRNPGYSLWSVAVAVVR